MKINNQRGRGISSGPERRDSMGFISDFMRLTDENKAKIHQVIILLKNTNLTIEEICRDIGIPYSDDLRRLSA
jgi:hypothetical protein